MTYRFTLEGQITLGMVVAVLMGFLMNGINFIQEPPDTSLSLFTASPHLTPTAIMTPISSPTFTPMISATQTEPQYPPFQTMPGVWLVSFDVFREAPPRISRMFLIDQGRLSDNSNGDSSIHIYDAQGNELFQKSFQPVFLVGEPLQTVEKLSMLIVVPHIDGEAKLKVITPQGETEYVIPEN